jgi:uncharacterized protein (AIM24 family)
MLSHAVASQEQSTFQRPLRTPLTGSYFVTCRFTGQGSILLQPILSTAGASHEGRMWRINNGRDRRSSKRLSDQYRK